MTHHLTEDQITEIVIAGEPTGSCEAHLSACPRCREKVAQELALFGSSVQAFNQASLAWSEAQPRTFLPGNRSAGFNAPMLAFAALAMAFVAVPVLKHQQAPAAVVAVTSQETPSDIAADNALLQSVNVALAANEPSPLDEYHLDDATIPASKTQLGLGVKVQ